jgi:hypothetical protein
MACRLLREALAEIALEKLRNSANDRMTAASTD